MKTTISADHDVKTTASTFCLAMSSKRKTLIALATMLLASGCDKEKFDQVANNISQSVSGAAENIRTGLNRGGPAAAGNVAAKTNSPIGKVKTAVNLRSGPSTDQSVLASLKPGSEVEIIGARDGWFNVRVDGREGWTSAEYVAADTQLAALASPALPANTVEVEQQSFGASVKDSWKGQSSVEGAIGPNEARIEISGYTQAYRGVRAQTRTGAFELALDELDRVADPNSAVSKGEVTVVAYTEEEPVDNQGFKGQDKVHLAIERGTLLLENGDLEEAVLAFEDAENTLGNRGQRSRSADALTDAASYVGSLFSGDGEFGPYNLQPYEEILFLNFKTIGYLLQGKPEAYNVGRRAADRQNELRAEFIELIEKAKAENKEEQKEQTDPEAKTRLGAVRSWFDEIGNSYSRIGDRVPSAYVNPFGYYVVGMVNEIKSYSDPSLRDNARIAYEKALELNPSSPVIKEAAKAMDGGFARSDQKVVHLIGSIGMAPEKRVASYGLPLPEQRSVMPLKFPIYKDVPDIVKTIEVRDSTGQRKLGSLSSLADIEAMAIRYQKDRLASESVKFGIGLYPRLVEKNVLSSLGAFGNAVGNWRDQSINPDMRAWLALPARFHAARLVVPASLSKVQLRSFDANGRELGRQIVELPSDTHGFAYIRAVDKVLTAQTSVASWL
ncbi:MAG: SH3 domain-containing protein [Geminicoccales bacterium]